MHPSQHAQDPPADPLPDPQADSQTELDLTTQRDGDSRPAP